jgi:pyridoxal phosphate-dependent aminotransferase EpsN
MTRIYLSPPDVRGDEREAVLRSIDSNWIAPLGPELDAFEQDIQAATGVSASVGVTSGTAALHLALLALGVSTGDDVLVATFTFAAPANAVAYVGARPVLVDADPMTWTLSPDLVEEELRARARTGTLPKAAIPVDLYGQCADYGQLMAIFDEYGIPVVEDAAEALGASAFGRMAGSFGRCAAMSFNGNKIITTSSGGMFLSNDPAMSDRVRYLANQAREPVSHYEHVEVGYNYRLSNLLAAFGRSQLATLQARIDRRKEINFRYRSALEKVAGIEFMPMAAYGEPNFWLTCVLIDPAVTGTNPEQLRQELETYDIESRRLWKPMHLQPAFSDAPSHLNGVSESCFNRGLCLPSGSGMTDHELDSVIEHLTRAIPSASQC